MSATLMQLEQFVPFVDGLDHPEGVTWGHDGYVYAGGEAGQIYRIGLEDGRVEEFANTGGFVLGLCLDGAANVYACDHVKHCVFCVTPAGAVSVYSSGSPERAMVTPNYPVFDAGGNLYVSDSGEWDQANGCLYRVKPGGETELINDDPLPFPNGLALSPDGRELYTVLSTLPGVGKFSIGDDRQIGPLELVVELPQTVPDGLAFDSEGNLYVSCYTPDYIYRLDSEGKLDLVVEDPQHTTLSSPTNIAFGGRNLSTLIVASLGRWHLCKAEMSTTGKPLWYPDL